MKKLIVLLTLAISSSALASGKASEILAKEEVRQAQCAEITTASTSTKCGVVNGGVSGFGFNLPDDYSARETFKDWDKEHPERYTVSTFEMEDRVIVQYRMISDDQIKPAKTITKVILK